MDFIIKLMSRKQLTVETWTQHRDVYAKAAVSRSVSLIDSLGTSARVSMLERRSERMPNPD